MSSDKLYLCLDQGGHASRAFVFDDRGRTVCQSWQPLTPVHSDTDTVEYSAPELLDSLRHCVDEVVTKLGERKPQLVAAGLATQRSNIACWDKIDGKPLGPVISWQDRRHRKWLQQFQEHADHIHEVTGLYLSPHYGASKLRWCLDNLPAVQQARQAQRLMLGPMASYLARQLTKENRACADPVNASRTQLWSLQHHDWDDYLLGMFGIERGNLPRCVPTFADYGHLAIEGIELPLTLVTGDQAAALYAYGQLQPDTAYINIGTGAFISRPTGPLPIHARRLLTSLVLQTNESSEYVLEGTVNGAGAALDWLAQQHAATISPQQLETWMQEESRILLFLNGVSGVGAPYWLADFVPNFVGEGTFPQQTVAVMESIAFLLQANLDEMDKLAFPPQQLQVSGGLAHHNALCQTIANLSQLPVYRPLECEATARGTAYLLAGRPSQWPEPYPGQWFEPADDKPLRQRYSEWQVLMLRAMREKQGRADQ